MGSFNTTCAISRTPILEGQKARVFFLEWNSSSFNYNKNQKGLLSISGMTSFCYPYEIYKVIGYPLSAKYCDYNQYEFDDKELENLTLNAIRSVYVPNKVQEGFKEDDYNSYHDYLNIDHLENMKQVQDIIHSGSLRCKSPQGESFIVNMAIHEEIYQELILKYSWQKFHNEELQDFDFLFNKIKHKMDNNIPVFDRLSKMELESIKHLRETYLKDIGTEDYKGNIITEESIESRLIDSANNMIWFHSLDASERQDWLSTSTNPKIDIIDNEKNKSLIDRIISSWVGGIITNEYFKDFNLHFEPVSLGHQEFDFQADAKRLRDTADIVSTFMPKWADEEHITLESERKVIENHYFELKKLEDRIHEWYDEGDECYKESFDILNAIKENNIKSYQVGDGSDFDKYAKEYNLYYNIKDGDNIIFKY